jgi:predicted small lipoprotein YifL
MILGSVFLALMSCGKKGPPFLPKTDMPLKVEQLKGQWTNEAVLLQGSIPALKGQKRGSPGVTGCRVYHAWYSLKNAPCEGCPIKYSGFQEIRGKILAEEEFLCEVFVEKKQGIHFFEVRLLDPKGEVGPPSNRVKLIIED